MTTVSQAIAERNSRPAAPATTQTELAIQPGQDFWTAKQQAALSVLGIRGASSADLAVFLHYCQKTGLDPFSRQIYGIMRRVKEDEQWVSKFTIQVGIDGFRVIRDRVAGRLGVTVEYEDTIWYDGDGGEHRVWLYPEPPAACRVTVLKDGHRFPAVLRTASYIALNKHGKPMAQWATQPDHMIEKCAEAFALRRAFPHDLGGLYIDEEMPPAQPARKPRGRAAAAQHEPAPALEGASPADEPQGGAAERQPGKGRAPELRDLHIRFSKIGVSDRGEKLHACAAILQRDLDSSAELTPAEIAQVHARITELGSREALIEAGALDREGAAAGEDGAPPPAPPGEDA